MVAKMPGSDLSTWAIRHPADEFVRDPLVFQDPGFVCILLARHGADSRPAAIREAGQPHATPRTGTSRFQVSSHLAGASTSAMTTCAVREFDMVSPGQSLASNTSSSQDGDLVDFLIAAQPVGVDLDMSARGHFLSEGVPNQVLVIELQSARISAFSAEAIGPCGSPPSSRAISWEHGDLSVCMVGVPPRSHD